MTRGRSYLGPAYEVLPGTVMFLPASAPPGAPFVDLGEALPETLADIVEGFLFPMGASGPKAAPEAKKAKPPGLPAVASFES